jgi:hypothetical protein
VLAAAFAGLIYLYIRDKLALNKFTIFLTLLLLADIYLFAFNQNNGPVNPTELYSQNSQLITRLKDELKKEQFRINMREGGNMLFQRYQGAVDRIPLIEGYNVLLLQRRFPVNKPDSGSTQSIDLMNVKYKIKVNKPGNSMTLIANPSYLPKAMMFYDVKVIENDSLLKKYMESREFDYRRTLVLEKNPGNVNLPRDTTIVSEVSIAEYGLNRIRIDVNTPENGFLLLSEVYYPAWKAFIDGKETEIFRVDYCLRSVYVEKGKHTVEFVYESSSFRSGMITSIAALILSIVGLIYFKHRKSPSPK